MCRRLFRVLYIAAMMSKAIVKLESSVLTRCKNNQHIEVRPDTSRGVTTEASLSSERIVYRQWPFVSFSPTQQHKVSTGKENTIHTAHNASAQRKHLFQVCALRPSCFQFLLQIHLSGSHTLSEWIKLNLSLNYVSSGGQTVTIGLQALSCGNSFMSGTLN